ncbi:50S ribosomal protein L11 methyltransferase [Polyangium jinanense]|uniref:50S ribosomal protein L11 methyltransferase n=1 Tax=Polyangium jinanense TaxID=2829994 RepID=A0A9X3XFG0_9BACT|nr:50S ribosomal protein L11 methyltransferase [Polyangium jinanense]MDC3961415.1 50S ribosomal protein L11 methyltransferase [Polyangium jinanense]MDC3987016.1 50S ribosomal protein L11 methyltransferase [Polyangium jinanense]
MKLYDGMSAEDPTPASDTGLQSSPEHRRAPRAKLRVVADRARARALVEEGHRLAASFQLERALERFEEASTLDADNEAIVLTMNGLLRKLVPRWYFAMLNDHERNQAFERALEIAIGGSPCTVLDVGSGTGLLAMMAARAGAGAVFTCESVVAIARLARRIIAENKLDHQISVIPRVSTDLVAGRDIPRRADLLVTETFDCGLLGEGILPIVRHAREKLLRPEAKVIPGRAKVCFQLLESDAVHRNNFAFEVGGFDVSLFNQVSTKTYFPVRLRAHPHAFLSPAAEAFEFDFERGPLDPRTCTVSVTTKQRGRVHGIAFWFELDLGGGVVLTNAPTNHQSHWMQAVQCFETPLDVERNQVVTVTCKHDDTSIRFSLA